jgi:hypothetical protein
MQFFISAATEHLRHQQSHERRVFPVQRLRERRGGWRIKFGWIDGQRPSELLQHRDACRYCGRRAQRDLRSAGSSCVMLPVWLARRRGAKRCRDAVLLSTPVGSLHASRPAPITARATRGIPPPPDEKNKFITSGYASYPQCYPYLQADPDTNVISWQARHVSEVLTDYTCRGAISLCSTIWRQPDAQRGQRRKRTCQSGLSLPMARTAILQQTRVS